jgi:hypothetical protein
MVGAPARPIPEPVALVRQGLGEVLVAVEPVLERLDPLVRGLPPIVNAMRDWAVPDPGAFDAEAKHRLQDRRRCSRVTIILDHMKEQGRVDIPSKGRTQDLPQCRVQRIHGREPDARRLLSLSLDRVSSVLLNRWKDVVQHRTIPICYSQVYKQEAALQRFFRGRPVLFESYLDYQGRRGVAAATVPFVLKKAGARTNRFGAVDDPRHVAGRDARVGGAPSERSRVRVDADCRSLVQQVTDPIPSDFHHRAANCAFRYCRHGIARRVASSQVLENILG